MEEANSIAMVNGHSVVTHKLKEWCTYSRFGHYN